MKKKTERVYIRYHKEGSHWGLGCYCEGMLELVLETNPFVALHYSQTCFSDLC